MKYIEVQCNNCGSTESRVIAKGPDFEYRCAGDEEFKIVECNSCGLVYLNPKPAPEELAAIYPENYIPYRFDEHLSPIVNKARMTLQKSKVRAISSFAGPDDVIWDVGCGGGFLLQCMQKYGPSGWRLLGIDISERALEKVRSRGIDALCGRFETMDLQPESANIIILNQVIEHLDDPAAVVAKAHSVLKPGGHLFIETPSLDGWDAKLFSPRHWGGWHFPRHWTLYTRETMKKLLEEKGFSIVKLEWLLSPNFWAQSVHHVLVDRGISEKWAQFMDCKNLFVMCFFSALDVFQTLFGHTSNMRIVGRKA
ncbi:MAG: methyltransferase domain-containing protein [bacterium]